jgi:hypothetical protein
VAVTFLAAAIVSTQLPVPVQSPLQPVNTLPASAVAASVTSLSVATSTWQVAPQSMPLPVTRPLPAPLRCTVSVTWGGASPATTSV